MHMGNNHQIGNHLKNQKSLWTQKVHKNYEWANKNSVLDVYVFLMSKCSCLCDPLPRCNDGSPALYYSAGQGGGDVMLYLEVS